MSSLLDQLQSIDPAITAAHAAELRSGLVGINQQTQLDPDSSSWTLNRWWQWLDDEGFSRADLLDTLNSLGRAVTGQQAWDQLTDDLRSHAEDSQGLLVLLNGLEQRNPELPARLHNLEALALAENRELAQTAGGMSKAVKGGLYAVGSLAIVGCLVSIHSDYKALKKLDVQLAEALEREARAAEKGVADVDRTIRQDVSFATNDASEAASDLLHEAAKDPTAALTKLSMLNRDVFENRKDIGTYTPQDVLDRAFRLTCEHTLAFVGKIVSDKIASEVRNSPEFRKKVMEAAESDPEFDDIAADFMPVRNAAVIAKAEQSVVNGDWFAEAKDALRNTGLERQLRNQEVTKASDAYRSLLTREVTAAQAQLARDAENPFLSEVMGEAKTFIGYSEVKVDAEIATLAAEAEAVVRDAEDAAGRAARDSERLL